MKIEIKEGVIFEELNDQLLRIMKAYHDAMELFNVTPVVTSSHDGTHLPNSLHYKNLALDLRTRDLNPDQRDRLMLEMKSGLGADYVLVTEADHLHVQFGKASDNPEAT
jgi:hypothetical protein